MPDELDTMLDGENQETPSGSQPGNQNNGSNSETPNEGAEGQEIEKVEFDQLSGDAQDRFRKIYRDRQEAIRENQRLKQLLGQDGGYRGVPPPPGGANPEVKEALTKLDAAGVATKEFVQQQVQDILARKSFYDELGKLETELDGGDGRPKFVREEYDDYVNRHPQYKGYLPRDVYNIMYEDELLDWKVNHRNSNSRQRTHTLRPTATSGGRETELTVEQIEEKLSSLPEPQRSQWYEQNKDKINAVVARVGK